MADSFFTDFFRELHDGQPTGKDLANILDRLGQIIRDVVAKRGICCRSQLSYDDGPLDENIFEVLSTDCLTSLYGRLNSMYRVIEAGPRRRAFLEPSGRYSASMSVTEAQRYE